jgi:hypothetical protein
MDMTLAEFLKALQSGGNAALIVCAFVIWRAGDRLARIEKALDRFIEEVAKK